MKNLTFLQLQEKYLQKMYELAKGTPYVQIDQRHRELNEIVEFGSEQYMGVAEQLQKKGWGEFGWAGCIFITSDGIEKIQNDMAQNYADKELFVLKTIDEMSKNNPRGEVHAREVQNALGLSFHEFYEITLELYDRKRYLGAASDEHIKLSPAGKEFLQGKSNMSNHQSVRDIYNTYVNAPSNNQIGGQYNTQNAQINLNPEFDNAIKAITDLIQSSSISGFKRDDLLSTIEHIKQLPSSKPSPELVEHAKSKISYLDTVIKGTDLAIKVAPYLPALVTYFERLIK